MRDRIRTVNWKTTHNLSHSQTREIWQGEIALVKSREKTWCYYALSPNWRETGVLVTRKPMYYLIWSPIVLKNYEKNFQKTPFCRSVQCLLSTSSTCAEITSKVQVEQKFYNKNVSTWMRVVLLHEHEEPHKHSVRIWIYDEHSIKMCQ